MGKVNDALEAAAIIAEREDLTGEVPAEIKDGFPPQLLAAVVNLVRATVRATGQSIAASIRSIKVKPRKPLPREKAKE